MMKNIELQAIALLSNSKYGISNIVNNNTLYTGGVTINDESYYMFGVNKDISFKIVKEENFSYKLVDRNNKEIDVSVIEEDNTATIMAPIIRKSFRFEDFFEASWISS